MSYLLYTLAVRLDTCNSVKWLRLVSDKRSLSNVPQERFRKFYEFPFIKVPRTINRLKLYQTAITVLGIPSALVLQWLNVVPYGVHEPVLGFGVTGCVVLYSFGWMSNKLVGSIYLSEDCHTVKISRLDFWGRRVDEICPTNDILPLSELPDRPEEPYINLRRYSTKERLRFTLRYGKVTDKELFEIVFGESLKL